MSKVRLTEEQARDLEEIKRRWGFDFVIHTKIHGDLADEYESLKMLTPSALAKAWFIGYEVEPQFKEGDIIIHNGKMFKHASSGFIDYRGIRHANELEKQLFELGRTEPKLKKGDVIVGFKDGLIAILKVNKIGLNSLNTVHPLEANEMLEKNKIISIYPIETRIKVGDMYDK